MSDGTTQKGNWSIFTDEDAAATKQQLNGSIEYDPTLRDSQKQPYGDHRSRRPWRLVNLIHARSLAGTSVPMQTRQTYPPG